MEITTITPPPAASAGNHSPPPPAAPPPAPASAGQALGTTASWFEGFQNAELKSFVETRKFDSPEKLAESYVNLEKMKGVPADRLLKLPEKMEGDEARAVFERLGTPKEAKEYGLPRDEKATDHSFTDWAEKTFHENNLTKTQAKGLAEKFDAYVQSQNQAQTAAQAQALQQADTKLRSEWGQNYDANINIAKQGAKILGLDAKSLDSLEALQGRDALFKSLHRIGVSVGESTFVDGSQGGQAPATVTPEQAQAEIKTLLADQKFVKKVSRGDTEALAKWNHLNKLASPGEKQIG